MCVLHPGLWVKKHDGLSLCEGELLQWNTLIKIKIVTVTLFWQFKACVLCQFFLKSLYIFKISQGRKLKFEISIQKDFGHVSYTQIAESGNKWFIIDNWEKISLVKKTYRFNPKAVILFWTLYKLIIPDSPFCCTVDVKQKETEHSFFCHQINCKLEPRNLSTVLQDWNARCGGRIARFVYFCIDCFTFWWTCCTSPSFVFNLKASFH